jgi:hypothetical protein
VLFPPRFDPRHAPEHQNAKPQHPCAQEKMTGAKQKPIRVVNHNVAGDAGYGIAPVEFAPAPMKPIQVRMPKGRGMTSIRTSVSVVRPEAPGKRFPRIMLADAVRQTRIVVRKPAARPRSLLFKPRTVRRSASHLRMRLRGRRGGWSGRGSWRWRCFRCGSGSRRRGRFRAVAGHQTDDSDR